MGIPVGTEIARKMGDPFSVLISTILSLRTKDEVTRAASIKLFERGKTPEEILAIPQEEIAALVYPVGFYKTKAATIRQVCRDLLDNYDGKVPPDLDELLKLKGVGRKTANLVIILGFGMDGVCVDTHVHRISNRLGYVKTKNPDKTEEALRKKLPRKYWIEFNDLLVTWGQNICKPISPFCSKCGIEPCCRQVDVTRHR
ncbi:endonuclease III domain-containing protein [Thermodesulfobacteriota bacterium]